MSGTPQDEQAGTDARDEQASEQASAQAQHIRLPRPARDHDTRTFLANRERTGRRIREEARNARAGRGKR